MGVYILLTFFWIVIMLLLTVSSSVWFIRDHAEQKPVRFRYESALSVVMFIGFIEYYASMCCLAHALLNPCSTFTLMFMIQGAILGHVLLEQHRGTNLHWFDWL